MIIRPSDICDDWGRAKFGVAVAANELGIKFNCNLSSIWTVDINGDERVAFLELAREMAKAL